MSISPLTSRSHLVFDEINFDQSGRSDFFLKKTAKIWLELSTPRGALFCFFFKRKRLQRACLVAMATTQRRLPCVVVTQKLRAVSKESKFIFPVLFPFSLCFSCQYLFCFGRNGVAFFLLLLFLVILAVSVCLYRSFCCSSNGFVLVLVTQKHKYSVLTLSVCVVLACRIFFTTFKVVFCSCRFVVVFLAVLFRSCCCCFFVFCFDIFTP